MSKRQRNIKGFLDGLRPIKRINVSDWADANVILTSENSNEAGPYQTSRVPFMDDIQKDLSPTSLVTDIIGKKGVQLTFTTAGLNAVGCMIDTDPCAIMYIMPTLNLAEAISKDRFTPMVQNSKSLRKKVRSNRTRDSGNTILTKAYPGGRVNFAGANSAASLRSRPARLVIMDEIDAYPSDVGNEGSPISLVEKRQVTYGDRRKTFKLSTPKEKGVSAIDFEYEQTDQRMYFVPCPECGTAQHLKFDNLKWDPGNFDSVRYQCEDCGHHIQEYYKTQMLEAGVWIPTAPQNINPHKKGYFINSLYSPLGMLSWARMVEMYESALKKKELMKTFVNTILGESYAENEGDAPAWEALYNRACESYTPGTIPTNDVAFLTCGVDVQRDRIELEVVGWCNDKVSYSIDYKVIEGNTSQREPWDILSSFLEMKWAQPDKSQLQIKIMCVDSGYNANEVYAFVTRHPGVRVIAVKGEGLSIVIGIPKQVQVAANGKKIGTCRVWGVGEANIKSELYGWLLLTRGEEVHTVPHGYCFFPQYAKHYFKMLTAERLRLLVNKKGYMEYTWTLPSHTRNEALDCRVYARAGASVIGLDVFTPADFEKMRTSYLINPNAGKDKQSGSPFLDGESFW